jgi:hypothetical protein
MDSDYSAAMCGGDGLAADLFGSVTEMTPEDAGSWRKNADLYVTASLRSRLGEIGWLWSKQPVAQA